MALKLVLVIQDVAPVNIGESLKATAEAALGLSGFVYDESSGLYYNYTSQYYYDPVGTHLFCFANGCNINSEILLLLILCLSFYCL